VGEDSKSDSGDSNHSDIRGPEAARARAAPHKRWGSTDERFADGALALFPSPEDAMRYVTCAVLFAGLLGCGEDVQVTQPQQDLAQLAVPQYTVVRLGSLGGTQSRGMAINAQGWVAGWSNQPDGSRRAALWKDGSITPIGTLGGPSSTVPWPGLNDEGMVVGISQTGEADPLHEDWSCELGGFLPESTDLLCRGFVWQNDVMGELPTLGGNHDFATGVNNLGQVVGWAETPAQDPTCVDAQVLRFHAVLWEPKSGSNDKLKARELHPFPGDVASAATAINDEGQVVGISGRCDQSVGRFSALHAVLWDKNGAPTEIPNLGGKTWHTPMDINAQGDVVGFSNPPGAGDPEGEFIARAFHWTHGAATVDDLKALAGDLFSEAFAINAHGQVVGVSFGGASGARAFIWQNDVLTNLNDLVDIAPDVLVSAQDINDAGQITGRVRDGVTGKVFAFVATPIAN
jgi:probable HAF family extracellular repeat protein